MAESVRGRFMIKTKRDVKTTHAIMSLTYLLLSLLPQALSTGLTSRVAKDPDSALISTNVPQERSAKRNAQQINYAEFDNVNDDFDFEDDKNQNVPAISIANTHNVSTVQKHLLKPVRFVRSSTFFEGADQIENVKASPEILIPIKLNIEYNGGTSRLMDFFMWNINESLITVEQFAASLASEMELTSSLQQEITESINKQIEDYQYVSNLQLPAHSEYHVIIEISVNLNKKLYEDKIEWDLKQNDITPEEFAETVVADLGLSLEFKPAIAHSLHETILRTKKEILDGTYNHELHKYQQLTGLIFESNIRIRTDSSLHNGNAQWEPLIEILSPLEIEKREIERERNSRRLKRENMRREVDDLTSNKRRATGRRRDDSDWRF